MSIRATYIISTLSIGILLLLSLYLQFFDGVIPCPLCTLQRLCFLLLAVFFFIGIIINKQRFGRMLVNSSCIGIAGTGMMLAGRQIWLQHFPSADSNECGVSLQYMMEVLPMNQVLHKIISGTAECTARGFEFLHLNIAEWSLMWFILFFILGLSLLKKDIKR